MGCGYRLGWMYPSSSSIIAVFYCQVCYPSVGFLWPCFLVSSHCNCCSLYGSEYPQQSLILKPRHCFLEYFSNLANSWHSKTAPTLQSWRPPKCSTVNGGVCVCDHRQPPIILVIITNRLQKTLSMDRCKRAYKLSSWQWLLRSRIFIRIAQNNSLPCRCLSWPQHSVSRPF